MEGYLPRNARHEKRIPMMSALKVLLNFAEQPKYRYSHSYGVNFFGRNHCASRVGCLHRHERDEGQFVVAQRGVIAPYGPLLPCFGQIVRVRRHPPVNAEPTFLADAVHRAANAVFRRCLTHRQGCGTAMAFGSFLV